MIPKIIHYVWLGEKEKPNFVNACIVSWKECMPDYQIIEWNEKNVDIEKLRSENRFFDECYKRKAYAYMSDYIRLKIIYEYGGIYFDTDIQTIKSFDNFLNEKLVLGKEDETTISVGVICAEKNNPIIKKAMEFYDKEIWDKYIFTIPKILTYTIGNTKDNLKVLPQEYCYPFKYGEKFELNCITENTYTIHWWNASWTDKKYNAFLNTKHIKNPLKRKLVYFKKVCGFYYRNLKSKIKRR